MTFDEVVALLREWSAEPVVVTMWPEDTTMRGRLVELDAAGIGGVLFGLSNGDGAPSGVAIALFADAISEAALGDDGLVVRQDRVTVRVRRE